MLDLELFDKELAAARAIPLEWSRNLAVVNLMASWCESAIARVRDLEADPKSLLKVRIQTGQTVVNRLLAAISVYHHDRKHTTELEDCQDEECFENVNAVIVARRELGWTKS